MSQCVYYRYKEGCEREATRIRTATMYDRTIFQGAMCDNCTIVMEFVEKSNVKNGAIYKDVYIDQ